MRYLFGSTRRIFGNNLGNGMGRLVLCRIYLLTERGNLLELFKPQFVDFLVEGQKFPFAKLMSNTGPAR
jgi:hypothetical protein